MKHEKRLVTVEDLLRLKRAERPPAEFWGEFDRELRAKQLAALVAKRPWWQRTPRVLPSLRGYQLPLGAAAVLAITFLSVRDYAPVETDFEVTTPEPIVRVTTTSAVADPTVTVAEAPATLPIADDYVSAGGDQSEPADSRVMIAAVAEPVPAASRSTADAFIATDIPLFGSGRSRVAAEPTAFSTPSGRSIAANFAAAQSSETIGAQLIERAHGFEARGMPVRVARVEPLQQITPPGEARRARYLRALVSTTSADRSAQTSERMANRISPEELYDQVRRLGTRHGGINLKF